MNKFDKYFTELSQARDFDELDGYACVKAVPCDKAGERYTACVLWSPLIELERLLQSSTRAEFEANGVERVASIDEEKVEDVKQAVYAGDTAPCSKVEELGVRATAIIFNYKSWKEKRERLIKGLAGAFYDFEDITGVVKNFCTLLNVQTYSDLYLELMKLVSGYCGTSDIARDPCNSLFQYLEQLLKDVDATGVKGGLYDFVEKQTALQQLQVWYNNSKSGGIYALAFVCCKLRLIVQIEKNISSLRCRTFKQDGSF